MSDAVVDAASTVSVAAVVEKTIEKQEAVPLQTLVDEFVLLPTTTTTATDLKEESILSAKGEENEGQKEAQNKTLLPPLMSVMPELLPQLLPPPLPLVPLPSSSSSAPILLPHTTLISTAETANVEEQEKKKDQDEKKKQKKSRKSPEDFSAPPPPPLREPSKRARKMPDRLSSHTLSSVSLAIER